MPLLALTLSVQGAQLPEVVERTLSNRMRVLVVERPGVAMHLELFLQGGRAGTGALSPAAADLLARTLFRHMVPAATEQELKGVLSEEGAVFAALRQARKPGQPLEAEAEPLAAGHAKALAAIREQVRPLEVWDSLDALGASHRELRVEADYLSWGQDLPAAAFPAWCRLEAERLKRLPLVRFPLERERLLREIDAGTPPSPPAQSFLLATALSGHPYAQVGEFQRARVEALGLDDLKAYAAGAIRPERFTLVIVGAVKPEPLIAALEKVIGGSGTGGLPQRESLERFDLDESLGAADAPGGRRLTVSTLGATRLFFSWRVPPISHPDGAALEVLAQVLGASASSRLQQKLCGPGGIARKLSLKLGLPGGRQGNLLMIEAEPAEGRSLEELEQAVQSEVLRVAREPITESELHKAQVELETRQLLLQEDAATLAQALGEAHCLGGDWRLAFRALEAGRDFKPAEIQAAARTYLVSARATLVQFGPDPLLVPMDRTESRLLQVLTALVQRKLGGEAQAQGVLREAMRQIRMLSSAERAQTLKLLESQVRP